MSTVTSHRSGRSWSRNAELSSLLDSSRVFASQKCQQSQGLGGVVVAKRRTVVTFGLVSGFRVSKASTVTGREGRGRETQNCRHFWTRLGSLRLKSVDSHRDWGGSWSRNAELSSLLDSSRVFASQKCQQSQGLGGVVVAKRRTVVTFGLVSGFRVSKASTVTGREGRGRETQNCRHFWTRLGSLRLKSVNSHRDWGGSWSRNAELSSLLDSSRVFASQKPQQSQVGKVVVAKRRTVVTFGLVSGLRVSKVSTVTGIGGGRGRETQNCRHFWTRLGFSRLKSLNSHRSGRSWSRNAELSSLLDSSRVFASQKCQQSQGLGGVVVAKRRTVVTFGLVSGFRVSKASTVTGRESRGRETQNCRHSWTRLGSSRLKSVNSHRDREGRPKFPKRFRSWGLIIIACT